MPELPEMETYRRLISSRILNHAIVGAEVRRERTVGVPADEFLKRVMTRRIVSIRRRAKHLLFDLDSEDTLLLHLMLDGWMYIGSTDDTPAHESQVVLTFAYGQQLFFQGLRLGYLHIYRRSEVEKRMAELGPEPLDESFTAEDFHHCLRRKRGPIKFSMVDQHTLAGIGNCYSDESCFHAGILPLRETPSLSMAEFERLFSSLRTVLLRAISLGGYMEYPLFQGDLVTGGYNDHCLVYDRGGEPCLQCGQPIVETRHNKRKVFFCNHCQH